MLIFLNVPCKWCFRNTSTEWVVQQEEKVLKGGLSCSLYQKSWASYAIWRFVQRKTFNFEYILNNHGEHFYYAILTFVHFNLFRCYIFQFLMFLYYLVALNCCSKLELNCRGLKFLSMSTTFQQTRLPMSNHSWYWIYFHLFEDFFQWVCHVWFCILFVALFVHRKICGI